jgi:hypothetical protein
MCTCHDEALLNFLSDFRSAQRPGSGPAKAAVAVDQRSSSSVSTIARTRGVRVGVISSEDNGATIRLTGARPEGASWNAPTLAFRGQPDLSDEGEHSEAAPLPPPPAPPELVVVSRPSAPAWYEVEQAFRAPRHGALVRVLAVVMVFALAAGGSYYYLHQQPVRPIETQSMTDIVKTTVAAARHAGSAHVTGTIVQHGVTLHASIDISPKGGTEVMVAGGYRMQIVIAGGYGYLRATYGFLTRVLGMSPALALRYQNQWLKMATSSPRHLAFTGPAMINQVLSLQKPKQYPGKLLAGNNVLVQGTLPGTGGPAKLYISRKAPFYPMRVVFTDAQNGSVQLEFSDWGEHVKLTPPANAIPVSV